MAAEYSKPTSTRLTPAQRIIIESAAALRGVPVSKWIREVAVAEAWRQIQDSGVTAVGSPPSS